MYTSKRFNLIALTLLLSMLLKAGDSTSVKPQAGLCFKKMVGFYWMNGFTVDLSSSKILKEKINVGMNLASSSLGSALGSNAIPVHAVEVYIHKVFMEEKRFRPATGINLGYARANYGSNEFSNIPSSTILLSAEGGLLYEFVFPLRLNLSVGYNFISGNGLKGAGFIYPVFFQMKTLYRFR